MTRSADRDRLLTRIMITVILAASVAAAVVMSPEAAIDLLNGLIVITVNLLKIWLIVLVILAIPLSAMHLSIKLFDWIKGREVNRS